MKILAFTDLHSNKKVLKELIKKARKYNPDILISSGDLSNFGVGLKEVLIELNAIGKPVFVIPGNHETSSEINSIKKMHALKNLRNITNRFTSFQNIVLYGYSSCFFSRVDNSFEKKIPRLAERLKKYGDKKLIFVSHAPPFGTEVGSIWGQEEGCYQVREFIIKLKPTLTICGHFHNNFYSADKLNKSLIINPGPEGTLINLETLQYKFLFK